MKWMHFANTNTDKHQYFSIANCVHVSRERSWVNLFEYRKREYYAAEGYCIHTSVSLMMLGVCICRSLGAFLKWQRSV